MLVGTEITKDYVSRIHQYDDGWDNNVNQAILAQAAWQSRNDHESDAIREANSYKNEHGNGISTLVCIYNATGANLHYVNDDDSSGHIGKYTYLTDIPNGQWAVVLHVKSSGALAGSCAAVSYRTAGWSKSEILTVAWDTPYSGSNTANCAWLVGNTYNRKNWSQIHNEAENGSKKGEQYLGEAKVLWDLGTNSSPILKVYASHKNNK